jgi:ribosomal protein S18 acetylase RimI-like enzyme
VTFREIQARDLPRIFAVRLATWHNDNGREELTRLGITPESVRQRLAESHRGWLCEVDGRTVGFAMGDGQTGEMWVIAVLRECEGRGIGRRLLRLVEDWLASEGWQEIWLTTHTDEGVRAVGFYRQAGWVDWKIERGNRYMRKTLRPGAAPAGGAPTSGRRLP